MSVIIVLLLTLLCILNDFDYVITHCRHSDIQRLAWVVFIVFVFLHDFFSAINSFHMLMNSIIFSADLYVCVIEAKLVFRALSSVNTTTFCALFCFQLTFGLIRCEFRYQNPCVGCPFCLFNGVMFLFLCTWFVMTHFFYCCCCFLVFLLLKYPMRKKKMSLSNVYRNCSTPNTVCQLQ